MDNVKNYKILLIVGTIVLIVASIFIFQFEIILGFSDLHNYKPVISILNIVVFSLLAFSFPIINIFLLKNAKMKTRYLLFYSLLIVEFSKLIFNTLAIFVSWNETDNRLRWIILPIIISITTFILLAIGFILYFRKKNEIK
ncbi:MAG: hypothetical protein LBV51_02095 [Acholeplasmatales bacterium]|jgi:hypothetical protein|nr:hypothetical protein [Acholeplasmatales bacterium]